ncbi:HAD family hydrolase [Clostridium felsineum]|uniref:HAD-IIIC family phosphatase n=1 Tax=Clostridium felsineum TaxID=36839 RepID=UPI00214D3D8B|nr:HAD family hydrolase [Clostridium felsineum]MCR3757781.1 HAD family hydrolase [Clostridium felsineum]
MTTAEYIKEYKKLKNNVYNKNIKIAYLPSSTLRGVKETLGVMCDSIGVKSEIYVSEYNQYTQQILDSSSELYKIKPDIVIIAVDLETVLGDDYFRSFTMEDFQRQKLKDKILKEVKNFVNIIRTSLNCSIILHNFEVPYYSPMGILESKQEFGFLEMVEEINHNLRKEFKAVDRVYVFDYDKFLSKLGKNSERDYKMYYLGDMKLDMKYVPDLCIEYMNYIKPTLSIIKKCLVLDLDDTLWGGVVGEDGIEGIKLGPTGQGKPFYEFQKFIKLLFEKGVILAVNSKNNYEDAIEVIRNHPYMILGEENFADLEINWNDKASNIRTIAKKLNIGTDSIVFLDDDKLNCEIVKESLKEVKVVNMPKDPALYLKTIIDISSEFNVLYLTDEDRKKGLMYAENRKRQELKEEIQSIDEYLKALNMCVEIKVDDEFNIARIAQLTQKTNQFNMTTKRYFEEDIKKFMLEDNYSVLAIAVKDKFGDNGIAGVCIIKKENDVWYIDTLLLSCRVMGRKIEYAIMNYIEKSAYKKSVKTIKAVYIPTKKNIPVKSLYEDMGFKCVKEEEKIKFYEKSTQNAVKKPEFIDIV